MDGCCLCVSTLCIVGPLCADHRLDPASDCLVYWNLCIKATWGDCCREGLPCAEWNLCIRATCIRSVVVAVDRGLPCVVELLYRGDPWTWPGCCCRQVAALYSDRFIDKFYVPQCL